MDIPLFSPALELLAARLTLFIQTTIQRGRYLHCCLRGGTTWTPSLCLRNISTHSRPIFNRLCEGALSSGRSYTFTVSVFIGQLTSEETTRPSGLTSRFGAVRVNTEGKKKYSKQARLGLTNFTTRSCMNNRVELLGRLRGDKEHKQQHNERGTPHCRPLNVGLISRAGPPHTHTHSREYGLRPGSSTALGAAFSLI